MPGLLAEVDPDGLLEYSVVYTDRALNHMSQAFQATLRRLLQDLQGVYNAASVVIVPGGGTFGMEAVARQFAVGRHCLVLRNGWFSYRWSQILEVGGFAAAVSVLPARRISEAPRSPFAPAPLAEATATIRREKPQIVFAPHVETASGILLPDDYLRAIAEAVHAVGGLFVLDCVASGALWADMRALGVDILISAPQKGWSAEPCCAIVCLGEEAQRRLEETSSNSFALDLKQWRRIMQAYENGGHAYHATMPTGGVVTLGATVSEAKQYGLEKLRAAQIDLGARVRALLAERGFASVAADGFAAPGVVVCYTDDAEIQSGKKFIAAGLQTAAGVPLQCNEPADYRSFRIGLFGFDKLYEPQRTIANLEQALDAIAKH